MSVAKEGVNAEGYEESERDAEEYLSATLPAGLGFTVRYHVSRAIVRMCRQKSTSMNRLSRSPKSFGGMGPT
jgi:hypothetical protein